MTQDEYQQTYYCNCPKCSELPTRYRCHHRGQWAVCEPCSIRWLIGDAVIEECQEAAGGELSRLTQVLA